MVLQGPYMFLIEYRWREAVKKYTRKGWAEGDWPNGVDYVPDPSQFTRREDHIFYFLPRPSSLRKNVQIMWKVSHTGTKRLKKARFRNRETDELRLSGSFSETLRKEFEYYLKQESKFWLINPYMDCPDPDDHDYQFDEDDPDGWFVIIKSANFGGAEGALIMKDYNQQTFRERKVNYEIILERVERSDLVWD